MPMNLELVLAGLVVGFLIGSTGMGAGSLMAPILITLFNVSAVAAVGTDLLYSAGTKLVGGVRHLQLRTVHRELAVYMALGSVPSSVAGVYTLHRLAASRGAQLQDDLKQVIAWALLLVAVAVAVRTFVTLRALYTEICPRTARSTAATGSWPSASGWCSASSSGSPRWAPAPSSGWRC